MEFKFEYDYEDDVLSVYSLNYNVEESVMIDEDIVVDIDNDSRIVGLEIFYASEFLGAFNPEINKDFLKDLRGVSLDFKGYRNMWFIVLLLQSGSKKISQPLPPLRRSEYKSPLMA